jgi:recombinational DNA repair protein RecR
VKTCNDCFQIKPIEAFYLWQGKYRRAACNTCKNVQDHQRVLTKKLAAGDRSIVNCEGCDLLMRKVTTRKICLICKGSNDGTKL